MVRPNEQKDNSESIGRKHAEVPIPAQAAQMTEWVLKVERAVEAVFREKVSPFPRCRPWYRWISASCFLRASLRASTTAMPALSLDPGGKITPDDGQIDLVIMVLPAHD